MKEEGKKRSIRSSFTGGLLLLLSFLLIGCQAADGPSSSLDDLDNESSTTLSSHDSTDPARPSDSSDSSGSSDSSDSSDSTGTHKEDPAPSFERSLSGGVILHAWNWGLKKIEGELHRIAEAGYDGIQISPMQPQKDYHPGSSWCDEWWKLYQPLGLSIATHDHALGTKEDLRSLCEKAKDCGLKIIVDVVANHLAGGKETSFHDDVRTYEKEIYDHALFHRDVGYANDGDGKSVVRGNIGGFPDLMTEDERVQKRVLALLKEYLDVGVSGFRFDAAKHIETPTDDKAYRSDFFHHVLDGAKEYARSIDVPEPYFYGEILNTCGQGRSYASYTSMMSVTDNRVSSSTLYDVRDGHYERLGKADVFADGLRADQVILWGESHDTYANKGGETEDIEQAVIDRTYAILAARKDATPLYFARPDEDFKVGSISKTTAWHSPSISAVNAFHQRFNTAEECFFSANEHFIASKHSETDAGMMIVGAPGKASFTVDDSLSDGVYQEMISKKDVIIKDGQFELTVPKEGIAVLALDQKKTNGPRIIVDEQRVDHDRPFVVSITVIDADFATYQIDDATPVAFNGTVSLTLGTGMTEGKTTLKVEATHDKEKAVFMKTYRLFLNEYGTARCFALPSFCLADRWIAAWVWSEGEHGSFIKGTLKEDVFTFHVSDDIDHFLLASFKEDEEASWDNHPYKTKDLVIDRQWMIYDCGPDVWVKLPDTQ